MKTICGCGHHSDEPGAWNKPCDITADVSTSSQEFHSKRGRYGDDMAEAYPDEQNFAIACRFDPGQQS